MRASPHLPHRAICLAELEQGQRMVASSECKLRCQRRGLPKALLGNLQHQAMPGLMQYRAFPLKGTRCPSAVKH